MNNIKHSKGPWEVRESNDGGATLSIIAVDEKGEWCLASVNTCMGKESQRNADLIASIPDLVDALEFGLTQNITGSLSTLEEFKRLARKALAV